MQFEGPTNTNVPVPTPVAKARRPATPASLDAISLFSGAGGLDLGCEQAGFTTRGAAEFNEVARRTLVVNAERFLPGLSKPSVFSDIVEDYAALFDAAGLAPGEASLMHGGPPCTPFSKSGYWLAYKPAGEDPKASLLDNYVEALRAVGHGRS